jgi:hypothetical protein
MGRDKVRHLVQRGNRFFWQPSETIIKLGLTPEALGTEEGPANARAVVLNNLGDNLRRSAKTGSNGPRPGTFSKLCIEYMESDEFAELKPRTKKDYRYYLGKIEEEFGCYQVRTMKPLGIKTYYKRLRKQVSTTWAYHILAMLRTILSWAVSENWIDRNPALDVTMKSPPKRKVTWPVEHSATYIVQAEAMGWASIVAMAYVFDSIGQSPVDVRTLTREAYDGLGIATARAKTGNEGAPIPLFPLAKIALDKYLATQPPKLPGAPLFTNDRIGGEWNESTLQKVHRKIRKAAGLPVNLQLQDFRTTAATESGAAGGTRDEIRGLLRHSTSEAAEHYVYPDARFVESIQAKRLALRNKTGQKVGIPG